MKLDKNFWNAHWESGQTGWDVGYATPPITEFMKNISNKNIAILIPGCGNAYEAEFLAENGFVNITLLDIAPKAVERLNEKFERNNSIKVINGDFFEHQGAYDLMIEQTFFCAQNPERRLEYVRKAYSLLKDDGMIVGLMFNKLFDRQGPPFGGTKSEYEKLFSPYFEIEKMEDCYNSIKPRMENEFFVKFRKRIK